MYRTTIFLTLTLSVVLALTASAQERIAYGLYGNFSDNLHSADFQHLPGVPSCCPRYETGHGAGPDIGALADFPFASDFVFEVRFGYRSLSATLKETETTTVYHNGAPTAGAFEHSLDASIATVGVEPLVGFRVTDGLRVLAGLGAGFVVSKTFDEREQIVQPDGAGTFADSLGNDTHSRIRNAMTGTIPSASAVLLSLTGGVDYRLPLNFERSWWIVPEAMYSLGLSKIATDLQWKASSIRFGIAIVHSPPESLAKSEPKHN